MNPPSEVTLSKSVAEPVEGAGEGEAAREGLLAGGGDPVTPAEGDDPVQLASMMARMATGIVRRKVITGLRMARGSAALPGETPTLTRWFPGPNMPPLR